MHSPGEYEFLSNLSPAPTPYRGHDFPTSEHAYPAAKTDDHDVIMRIATTDDAEAKAIGRAAPLVAEWDRRKYAEMESVVEAKFRRNRRSCRQTRRHTSFTPRRGRHLARPDMGKLQLPPAPRHPRRQCTRHHSHDRTDATHREQPTFGNDVIRRAPTAEKCEQTSLSLNIVALEGFSSTTGRSFPDRRGAFEESLPRRGLNSAVAVDRVNARLRLPSRAFTLSGVQLRGNMFRVLRSVDGQVTALRRTARIWSNLRR
jgi:hypothetical protein